MFLVNNSSAYIGGLNKFAGNSVGLYAEASYNVSSSSSDFYQFYGAKAIKANHSAQVIAQNNFWGQYPPNSADFEALDGSIIYYQPGNQWPWTGPLKIANTAAGDEDGEIHDSPSGNLTIDPEFLAALELNKNRKYEDALALYIKLLKRENSALMKKCLLSTIEECYRYARNDNMEMKNNERNFIDFLNKEVRPNLSANDELFAITLELENIPLINDKHFEKAIENLEILRTRYSENESTVKNALFNLGYIHYSLLENSSKGQKYFDELKSKYPEDYLTYVARFITGEIDSLPSPELKLSENITAEDIKKEFALFENYPNPFNPNTIIKYILPHDGIVTLKVYDVLGSEVVTLVNGTQTTGIYNAEFNASTFASGVYIYKLQVSSVHGSFMSSKKMILTK